MKEYFLAYNKLSEEFHKFETEDALRTYLEDCVDSKEYPNASYRDGGIALYKAVELDIFHT